VILQLISEPSHRAAEAAPLAPEGLAASARAYALRLTSWPSVTGTNDEAAFPHRLAALLRALPYFAENPDHVTVAPIPGDALGRSNVIAWVRGSGSAAVTLAGHFDTVSVEDYGDLKPFAGEAEELLPRLVARLRETGENPGALADLESGDFLPGRGLLDMKAGLAAGLAVLEAFAADPRRAGNLVLVATPDEEDRSAGMRAAADLLPGWLAERGLSVRLGINLDAIRDDHDGASGRVVAFGCIGKLLLSAFVVGKESHAAYPFAGVNAAYLAAELAAEIEGSPELAEDDHGALAAPPTLLGSRDLKAQYDVTLPGAAWCFWNVLLHARKAGEVLEIARAMAERAAHRGAQRLKERAARLKLPPEVTEAWDRVRVLSAAELIEAARARTPDFDARWATLAEALAVRGDLDLPTRSRRLVEEAWACSGLKGPAIVLGFGSMPYPAVTWPDAPELEAAIRDAMGETAKAHGVSIEAARFFPAIADMSFLGPVDGADLEDVAANTPLWGSSIRWDLARGATPGFPLVNIGPWGRDYHHWLERVHAPYAFEVLPALVRAVALRVLARG
jgi:arginine utilization protein RocB